MGSGCAFFDYDGDGWLDAYPGQPDQLARPAPPAHPLGAVPQRPRRDVHRRHPRGRARGGDVRHGGVGRRLRQRRVDRPLRHRRRRESPLPEPGGRAVRRRDRRGGGPGSGDLSHQRDVLRLRPGREPRPDRRQLRHLVGRGRPLLHPRRKDEVVLHPRVLQGGEPDPPSQPRRRDLRGRDQEGRALESRLEGAGGGAARPRRRRVARLRPRQRHAAEQALPQQRGRDLLRHRDGGGDRLRRDRGRARGHGHRHRRRLGERADQPPHRQLLERDDRPLPLRG